MVRHEIEGEIIFVSEHMLQLIETKQAKVVLYEDHEDDKYFVEISSIADSDDVKDTNYINCYYVESKAEAVANKIAGHFNIPLENKL